MPMGPLSCAACNRPLPKLPRMSAETTVFRMIVAPEEPEEAVFTLTCAFCQTSWDFPESLLLGVNPLLRRHIRHVVGEPYDHAPAAGIGGLPRFDRCLKYPLVEISLFALVPLPGAGPLDRGHSQIPVGSEILEQFGDKPLRDLDRVELQRIMPAGAPKVTTKERTSLVL